MRGCIKKSSKSGFSITPTGWVTSCGANSVTGASLAGCRVMNLHALTLSLRPPVRAGDSATVLLTRPGKEAGQAVGYLDDGTMVVVEKSREHVGDEVRAAVTSVLTTANGRMVFARPAS